MDSFSGSVATCWCDKKVVRSAEWKELEWAANAADKAMAKSSNMGIGQAISIDIIVIVMLWLEGGE